MIQFPYPLIEYRGDEVLERWAELRERGKNEGFYPVIIGDSGDDEILTEPGEINDVDQPAAMIESAARLNGNEVLKNRAEQDPEFTGDVEIGKWPETPSYHAIVTHQDMLGRPKEKVFVAKIPTVHSWEVPAFLGYGGWNDCPGPEEHVAVHRMWNEKYGAEIIAITGDVIECVVSRPPTTREEAMALAKEQFYYCTDIVFQGVETLSALAGSLQNHNAWFFWWD